MARVVHGENEREGTHYWGGPASIIFKCNEAGCCSRADNNVYNSPSTPAGNLCPVFFGISGTTSSPSSFERNSCGRSEYHRISIKLILPFLDGARKRESLGVASVNFAHSVEHVAMNQGRMAGGCYPPDRTRSFSFIAFSLSSIL